MIAKLIVHANSREAAIENMMRAIDDYTIVGIETTLPFGTFVMHHPKFRSGDFDTKFIENYFKAEDLNSTPSNDALKVGALIVQQLYEKKNKAQIQKAAEPQLSMWQKNRKSFR